MRENPSITLKIFLTMPCNIRLYNSRLVNHRLFPIVIPAMYLQFATLHKYFDTILISSAPSPCRFWSLPHIFHKFLEIIHYLSAIFLLFLVTYPVPLSGARCNGILFIRGHVWHGCGISQSPCPGPQ
jgi:hypothetical protein